jgi:starch synthase
VSLRILFAAGEALPFSKTGGLADVAYALPRALTGAGLDVRVLTPAYRGAIERLGSGARPIAELDIGGQRMRVLEGTIDASGVRIWLLDHPPSYARAGSPYADEKGHEHADNAWRFGCFSEAIARLALGVAGLGWRPHLVHLNDWHTGLAALWLGRNAPRPATVFTIHNLAYQGVFARNEFDALGLPPEEWNPEALEFYGGFSFMKAGLLRSDAITTVSPTYAQEIQTHAFGERLDGVLRVRAGTLRGIVNGIDADTWNPATDPMLFQTYDAQSVATGKRAGKRGLQAQLGLEVSDERPVFGFIGRLVSQKGADLLLAAREEITRSGAQLVLLGAGDRDLEEAFRAWAGSAPGRVAVHLGYDETLAHRIEAGADFFLMPSRYEPCGLNQMYSQRYGTIPIVHRTGGLRDTVTDQTGILFENADPGGVRYGLSRALDIFGDPVRLRAMQARGMSRDFDWSVAARQYIELYESLVPAAAA